MPRTGLGLSRPPAAHSAAAAACALAKSQRAQRRAASLAQPADFVARVDRWIAAAIRAFQGGCNLQVLAEDGMRLHCSFGEVGRDLAVVFERVYLKSRCNPTPKAHVWSIM